MTIAVPQFVSLLYIGKMFAQDGLVNGYLMKWGLIQSAIPFWQDATLAKVLIIILNCWVGIPYIMLICTGLLMNIPADLYESARIDGANAIPDVPQDYTSLYVVRNRTILVNTVYRKLK